MDLNEPHSVNEMHQSATLGTIGSNEAQANRNCISRCASTCRNQLNELFTMSCFLTCRVLLQREFVQAELECLHFTPAQDMGLWCKKVEPQSSTTKMAALPFPVSHERYEVLSLSGFPHSAKYSDYTPWESKYKIPSV